MAQCAATAAAPVEVRGSAAAAHPSGSPTAERSIFLDFGWRGDFLQPSTRISHRTFFFVRLIIDQRDEAECNATED